MNMIMFGGSRRGHLRGSWVREWAALGEGSMALLKEEVGCGGEDKALVGDSRRSSVGGEVVDHLRW